MRTLRSSGSNDIRYLHKDHLGSVDSITDEFGAVVLRLSFDAFGKRRGSTWTGTPSSGDWTTIAATTHRGFTYHEQLDTVGLVHMNGRVYDPTLGRFISADPTIQAPFMSQSLNRYSYVMNNPLSMIDPSGFSWLSSAWNSIKNFFKKWGRVIVAVVASVVTFGYLAPLASAWLATAVIAEGTITVAGAMVAGAVSGALAGGIMGGWRGALAGAVTGAILGGAGAYYGNTWTAGRVAIEGAGGGIGSEIQGGKFAQGFLLAAAFSSIQWAAHEMRAVMVEQSEQNPLNSSGTSDGVGGDQFKLGGGRATPNDSTLSQVNVSPLGGAQGGPGYIGFKSFGFAYKPGSFWDHLIEWYAGPHDWLSSFRYDSAGNLAQWSALGRGAFAVWSGIAVVPATPFALAAAVPSNVMVPAIDR